MSAPRPGQAPRVIILNSYGAQQKDWPLYYCHGSHDPGLCPLLALPGGTHSGAVHSISAFTHHRWHSSLCAEGGLPRTGPRSRAGNGQIASRQISCTHRTCNAMDPLSNLRATGDKAILFWYHHNDRFKRVSHLHTLCMYTQRAGWVIWKTIPKLFKLCLLFVTTWEIKIQGPTYWSLILSIEGRYFCLL